jgi:alpha-beta hydrolase superfamily lysophospholipase
VILWGHSNGGAISIKIVNKIKNCNKEEKINFKIEKLILNNSA